MDAAREAVLKTIGSESVDIFFLYGQFGHASPLDLGGSATAADLLWAGNNEELAEELQRRKTKSGNGETMREQGPIHTP